ncbi:ral guanine nucleotide dissociation stimulator-like [Alligator sinensis]|uniref:Ral guanine nucleotide dissociation stimulator-like n=1 Tax=Alligator sinensis TaxID=38654 RepID=A0A3Q0FWT3_ALLSI|nr:ral guanine nucleotide dissociation stimulator-like [Alligator sinensis]
MGSFGDTGRAEQEEGYGCSCIPLPYFLQRRRTREPRPRAGSQEGQERLFDSGDWRTLQALWRQQLQLQAMQKNVDALLEDFGNIHTFFSRYRTFGSPGEVLDMLLSRHGKLKTLSCRGDGSPDFSADSRAVLGNPIIFFLKIWLHFSPEDFREPPKYHTLEKVIAHLNKNVPGCDIEMEAKHLLHQFQNEAENESQPGDHPEDHPADQPGDQPGELPEVQPGEQPKGQPGDHPEGQAEAHLEDRPWDLPKVQPKGQPGEQREEQPGPEVQPRDRPWDLPESQPGDLPRVQPKGQPRDLPGDQPRNLPQETKAVHRCDQTQVHGCKQLKWPTG